jgi:hypothetical protein
MKKAGATITTIGNGSFVATKGDTAISWRINGGIMAMHNGDGHVYNATKRHPDTDAGRDLFMDDYYRTIKAAVVAINEPPFKSWVKS